MLLKKIPSRILTYPILGKRKASTQNHRTRKSDTLEGWVSFSSCVYFSGSLSPWIVFRGGGVKFQLGVPSPCHWNAGLPAQRLLIFMLLLLKFWGHGFWSIGIPLGRPGTVRVRSAGFVCFCCSTGRWWFQLKYLWLFFTPLNLGKKDEPIFWRTYVVDWAVQPPTSVGWCFCCFFWCFSVLLQSLIKWTNHPLLASFG